MSRALSLNARQHFDDPTSPDVEAVLLEFDHASLEEPLRFSTDPTVRLSDDPRIYGTRSTWRGDGSSHDFAFALVDIELPGEIEDTSPEARLVLRSFDASVTGTLRSFRDYASCAFALVRAGNPDMPEAQWLEMVMTRFVCTSSAVELTLSSYPIEMESWPSPRMTQSRFPGLYR